MSMQLWDEPARGAARQVTLVRLAGEIARALGGVGRIAVEGEVHRPTTSRGGWVFFTLRDRAAQIDVKVPAGHARRSRTVHGRAGVRGRHLAVGQRPGPGPARRRGGDACRRGRHRRADRRDPPAAGRRRSARPAPPALPVLPAVVGVVCGADAAVRKDIESVAAARFPGYPLYFEETTVSGPGASLPIVDALEAVVAAPGVEVVILARGGGDGPSLLPWSTRGGVPGGGGLPGAGRLGHRPRGDRPLCDEVADLRCGTPSIAAAAVVPDRAGLLAALDGRLARAGVVAGGGLDDGRPAAWPVWSPAGRSGRAWSEPPTGWTDARTAWRRLHPARRLAECRARLRAPDWRRPLCEAAGPGRRPSGRRAAAPAGAVAGPHPRAGLRRGHRAGRRRRPPAPRRCRIGDPIAGRCRGCGRPAVGAGR